MIIGVKPARPKFQAGPATRGAVLATAISDRGDTVYEEIQKKFCATVLGKTSVASTGYVRDHDNTSARVVLAPTFYPLPTTTMTMYLIYQKTDATLRVSAAMGTSTVGINDRLGAHLPFADGTIYYDFGTGIGNQRITATGATFGHDFWCFTNGPRGMEIWQNGTLISSGGQADARANEGGEYWLGAGGGASSDLAQYSLFEMYNIQHTIPMIQARTRDPWMVWKPTLSTYVRPVASAPATGNSNFLAFMS